MKKIGKISAIKREFNSTQVKTMQSELMNKGMTRVPGTGVFKFPYKEVSGKYRTGLDPNAPYISRIKDDTAREIERKRVTEMRDRLSEALSQDLSPNSEFWNYAKSTSPNDNAHVQPVKLVDGDNIFDLSDPWKELAFAWLRVHPTIASSFLAWQRGEFPADTQFYVVDDEVETAVTYKKKTAINKAIVKLDDMTPSKRIKVARVMGLPVSDSSKEEFVYNQLDTQLKQSEFKSGKFIGLSPVEVFTRFADMDDAVLNIKDLVKQAITHSLYRVKPSGKVYKGDLEIAEDEEALVKHLADDNNQDELIVLEQELKGKKLAAV
jgi:hypothetical protein